MCRLSEGSDGLDLRGKLGVCLTALIERFLGGFDC